MHVEGNFFVYKCFIIESIIIIINIIIYIKFHRKC